LGYNMYTSSLIEAGVQPLFPAGYDYDMDVTETKDPAWQS